jgi:hypothetical protein
VHPATERQDVLGVVERRVTLVVDVDDLQIGVGAGILRQSDRCEAALQRRVAVLAVGAADGRRIALDQVREQPLNVDALRADRHHATVEGTRDVVPVGDAEQALVPEPDFHAAGLDPESRPAQVVHLEVSLVQVQGIVLLHAGIVDEFSSTSDTRVLHLREDVDRLGGMHVDAMRVRIRL